DPEGARGETRRDRLARGPSRARVGLRRVSVDAHRRQFHPASAQAFRAGSRATQALPHRVGRRISISRGGRALMGVATGGVRLRIGTRASALALWQANRVADLIRALPGAPAVELIHIRTEGDIRTDVPLWAVDGRAFFTKEIDRALLANEIDIAVHSLKDVSTLMEQGIAVAAVLEREDPRDALISRGGASLADLPQGARVGTSSLRRRAFLARVRPDVVQMELRGNVPTRIEKLEKGEYDAIILATAGLKRLGLGAHISAHLPTQDFPN